MVLHARNRRFEISLPELIPNTEGAPQ